MRRWPVGVVLLAAGVAACASLTEFSPGIAFLEVRGPSPAVVAVGSTVILTARALDARSDSVAAEFSWFTPDTLAVFVNVATGAVTGRTANSTARIQARTGNASSPFFSISVVAPPAP